MTKYIKIYNQLIEKRKINIPIGYTEKHHIIPRCLNGSNDKENIVKLTAREHFVAHLLLAKIHGGILWAAINRMCNSSVHNSRDYSWIRQQFAKSVTGAGNPRWNAVVTSETRRKIGNGNRGKTCSSETKIKISKALKLYRDKYGGRTYSNRLKSSKSRGGKPFNVFKALIVGIDVNNQTVQKGEYIGTWNITRECSRQLMISHQAIGLCLKGKRRYTKGYICEYR